MPHDFIQILMGRSPVGIHRVAKRHDENPSSAPC